MVKSEDIILSEKVSCGKDRRSFGELQVRAPRSLTPAQLSRDPAATQWWVRWAGREQEREWRREGQEWEQAGTAQGSRPGRGAAPLPQGPARAGENPAQPPAHPPTSKNAKAVIKSLPPQQR